MNQHRAWKQSGRKWGFWLLIGLQRLVDPLVLIQ